MTIEQTISWHADRAAKREALAVKAAAAQVAPLPRHRATWGLVLLLEDEGSRWTWIPRRDRHAA